MQDEKDEDIGKRLKQDLQDLWDLQDCGTCDESHYYEQDGNVVEMPGKDKESILLIGDLYPFLRFCVNKK